MNRFMGMMPSNEIEKTVTFKDRNGWHIHIDAGPNGWTIRYADSSAEWSDQPCGTEENYRMALSKLKEKFPDIEEITSSAPKAASEIDCEC